ncbi:MAG: ribonuclease PH [Verrucomicrobia bacterium]|nr:ribonuclease PH [Verrucomicrobiota bacterium]
MDRIDGRTPEQLRPVSFEPDIAPHAHGSVLVAFGKTRVICSAMVEDQIPGWMKAQGVPGGWLTAEYSMLPCSTLERKPRDISRGKLDGRSSEIQRLIGRALRAVVDLRALGARTLWIDCDVLQADGGTRTASITGACVAVAIAFRRLVADGTLRKSPLRQLVAAVSTGVLEGRCLLDLCYEEDREATVDCNIVGTAGGDLVEVQCSGEEAVFPRRELQTMLDLAGHGIGELLRMQQEAIDGVSDRPVEKPVLDLSAQFPLV